MKPFVSEIDYNNKQLAVLPIRRGCFGTCACLGMCQQIIGYVQREEYEKLRVMESVGDKLLKKIERA